MMPKTRTDLLTLLLAAAAAPPAARAEPLPPGAVARLGTLRFRAGEWAPVAVVPGCKRFVTVRRWVTVWDAAGRALRSWPASADNKDAKLISVAVSPGGGKIAAGGDDDGTVRVWAADGKLLHTFRGHAYKKGKRKPSVLSLAFAGPDRLVSWGNEGVTAVWDLRAGRESYRFGAEGAYDLAANGARMVGVHQGKLIAWDVPTGQKMYEIKLPGTTRNLSTVAAVSGDGRVIAAGPCEINGTSFITIHEGHTGREFRRLRCDATRTSPRGLSPNGRRLFCVSWWPARPRWSVRDTRTGKMLGRHAVGSGLAYTKVVGFPMDADRIITMNNGGTLCVRDALTGRPVALPSGHHRPVDSVRFVGNRLVTTSRPGDDAGCIRTWDWSRGVALDRREAPARKPTWGDGIVVSPDGRLCVVQRGKDGLTVMKTDGGSVVRRMPFPVDRYPLFRTAFGRSGRLFAGATDDKLYVMRLRGDAAPVLMRPDGGPINMVAFSPAGRLIAAAVGDTGRPLTVWDVAARRPLRFADPAATVPPFQVGAAVAFSPDGRSLALARTRGGGIDVYEVASGRVQARIEFNGTPDRLAFAPAGRLLAAGGSGPECRFNYGAGGRTWLSVKPDPAIRVFDLISHREVKRFTGHRGGVTALAFSPDGRHLASGGKDTTAIVWDTSDLIGANSWAD